MRAIYAILLDMKKDIAKFQKEVEKEEPVQSRALENGHYLA